MEINNNEGTTIVRVKFWAVVIMITAVIGSLCIGYTNHGAILASHASEIRAISSRQDRQDQHMQESLRRIEAKLDRLIESN
jgi:hypothetical protein